MAPGRSRGRNADINMTPMIDVLLVLLVIFMIVAAARRGLDVQVPPPDGVSGAAPEQLVLSVLPGPRYEINRQPLDGQNLAGEIRAVFAERPRKVLFVDADPSLAYEEVVRALDASREAGVDVLGLMPAGG